MHSSSPLPLRPWHLLPLAVLVAAFSGASCKHDGQRGEGEIPSAEETEAPGPGQTPGGLATSGPGTPPSKPTDAPVPVSADPAGASPNAGAPKAPPPAAQVPAAPLPQLPAPPPVPATPAFLGEVSDPKDNPTTPEKVALGHRLFFDKRLSKDGSMSCESCHHPEKAWTSGAALDAKVGGAMNKRNAPSMLNLGYHPAFYWDGRMPTLEAVAKAAWTGQLGADPAAVAAALNGSLAYRAYFQAAFQGDASPERIAQALAAFLRALKSGDAPWDKFEQGDAKAVSKQVKRGAKVFQTARCTLCHVPPLYTDGQFHNVGIGTAAADGKRDHGRMDATKDPRDDGKFKTPSLREVAKTGPYFHDGGVAGLDAAIDVMLRGGTPNANLDEKLRPARIKAKDRAALRAFLESLTGKATFSGAPDLPQ